MPKFAIVINNPKAARDGEERRGWRGAHERAKGTVHAVMDSECPNGLPNCRQCGDPAHAAACRSQGHCPDCGTRHGIAPDSVLSANGYALELAD